MTQPEQFENVFFVGIGGIGMSALARYFLRQGKTVGGYDRTRTPLVQQLEDEGVFFVPQDDFVNLPAAFRNIEKTLVVYTPAIPSTSALLEYYRENKFHLYKRSAVLAQVANNKKTLAVAGTHGKTTTSAMLAHLLAFAGKKPHAFLGGVANNFNSNFLKGQSNWLVAEADEYDRSFLTLEPYCAIVTSVEADHLDVYGREEDLKDAFRAFTERIKPNGLLISHPSTGLGGTTYAIDAKADFVAKNVRVENAAFCFDLRWPEGDISEGVTLQLPGRHNIENALAACAAARFAGVSKEKLVAGLAEFSGVKRRFDIHFNTASHAYVDDYAHHPTELNAAIGAAREFFPGRKLTVVFQPHLFSRTRDFAEGFAKSLSLADEVWLMPIYPAREEPIEGVNSEMLQRIMSGTNVRVANHEDVLRSVESGVSGVLMTLGAGDIDKLVPEILNRLKQPSP